MRKLIICALAMCFLSGSVTAAPSVDRPAPETEMSKCASLAARAAMASAACAAGSVEACVRAGYLWAQFYGECM